MVWGSNRLGTTFNRDLPNDKIGESWDISCRPGEMGIIENGPNAGMTIEDYIKQDKARILGTRLAEQQRFPLLVKIIDANDALSVQVHPDDSYVRQMHALDVRNPANFSQAIDSGIFVNLDKPKAADTGKSEMWYVLVPPTDGNLVIGLKEGVTKDSLRQAYECGTVEECLNYLQVAAGDIINIPAGLVHALTPGVMVAEVQQNSDITYRLYDYNRLGLDGKSRQLHVEEALTVSDFDSRIPKTTVPGLEVKKGQNSLVYAIANTHFAVIKYELSTDLEETTNTEAFRVFTCVDGEVEILLPGGEASKEGTAALLPCGRSAFIPAGLGSYKLRPKQRRCVLLKSFVPDVETDFVTPLVNYGYRRDEIEANTAMG